jgi:hypothetical protein
MQSLPNIKASTAFTHNFRLSYGTKKTQVNPCISCRPEEKTEEST